MLGGGAVSALVAFAANLVLVRLLGPATFGRFALAGATVALLIGGLSLRPGLLAIRSRELPDGGAALWRWTTFEVLWMGALALLLSTSLPGWVALLLAFELGLHALSTAKALYERDQPYRDLALCEGVAGLGSQALAIGLAAGGYGVLALVARQGVLFGVQAAWLAWRRRWPAFSGALPRRGEFRRLAADGGGLWMDGWVESLFTRCLVLASGAVGGAHGAGLFAQAWRLALVPHQFLGPLAGRLSLNWAARQEPGAERDRDRTRLLRWVLPLSFGAALGAVLLARPIVPLLLGEKWRDAAPIVAALCGVIAATSPFALLKMHLLVERRERRLLGARAIQLLGLGLGTLLALGPGGGSLEVLAGVVGLGCLASLPVAAGGRRSRSGREAAVERVAA